MFGGLGRVIGVIFIVGGLLYGLVPGIRNGVNDKIGSLKDEVNSWFHPSRTLVRPSAVSISGGTRPHHGIKELLDDAQNTYWLGPTPPIGSRIHTTVTYVFNQEFDLTNLFVYNGVGDAQDRKYETTNKPQTVILTFPQNPDIKACKVTFIDSSEGRQINLPDDCAANGIQAVKLDFVDYYRVSNVKITALANVEFFKK